MTDLSTYPITPASSPTVTTDSPDVTVKPWELLSPCPSCGAMSHDSPHGTDKFGDPHWIYEHCWKCGFRPGTNVAISQSELTKQFAAFKQWLLDQTGKDAEHPTLNAPQPDAIAEMQAQMQEMQAELARYRQGADQGVPNHPPVTTTGTEQKA